MLKCCSIAASPHRLCLVTRPVLIAWVAAVVVGSIAVSARAQPDAARVVVEEVRRETLDRWRRVTGELQAPRRSDLAAEESGRVTSLDVELGDRVEQGEVLATQDTQLRELERDRLAAELRTREGIVDQREAELSQARRDLERFRRLREQGSANESELDAAETRVDILEAQLTQAEAQIATAQANVAELDARIENMTLRAPFGGRVVAKHTEVGQWLQSGDPFVEIVSLTKIDALLDVPERLVDQLRDSSARIRIRIEAVQLEDPDRSGVTHAYEVMRAVTAVVPVADPLSRLVPVRVRLDNPEQRIKPGMSVIGYVPTGSSEPQITVHKDAILRDDAGEYVYANMQGQATPIRIRSRYAVGDRVVVEPGPLQPGTEVVVEGNERLFPTQPLNPIADGGRKAD